MVGVHLRGEHQLGGTARATSDVTLDPGNWSLDNFGQVLVATIFNGKLLLGMQEQLHPEQLEPLPLQQILIPQTILQPHE